MQRPAVRGRPEWGGGGGGGCTGGGVTGDEQANNEWCPWNSYNPGNSFVGIYLSIHIRP